MKDSFCCFRCFSLLAFSKTAIAADNSVSLTIPSSFVSSNLSKILYFGGTTHKELSSLNKYSDNILKYYTDNKLDDINTYTKIDNKIDFRIIAMTNKGQLDMLKNMLRSASEVGVDMSLFDVYLTPESDVINVSAGFHSANFTKLTMLKLQTIIKAVEEHEMVLWVDNDIVFLKNPITASAVWVLCLL